MKTKQLKAPFKTILSTLNENHLLIDSHIKLNDPRLQKQLSFCTNNKEATQQSCLIIYDGVTVKSVDRLKDPILRATPLFIVDDKKILNNIPNESSYLLVKSSRKAWAYLAAAACSQPQQKLKLIAVTGTNGKTTTAWIITEILNSLGFKAGYIGTLGSNIEGSPKSSLTTPDPDTLYRQLQAAVEKGYEFVTLEASSHALSLGKLVPLKFSAAVFTSFSHDHLDYHKTLENYFLAKLSLFENYLSSGARGFIHADLYPKFESTFLQNKDLVFYGNEKKKVQEGLYYIKEREDFSGSIIQLHNPKRFRAKTPFWGDYNLDNFFVSLQVAHTVTGRFLSSDWGNIKQVPGRMEPITDPRFNKTCIFIDFSHTPDSLEKALMQLRSQQTSGNLYLVFGCGGNRDKSKRKIMGNVAEKNADYIFVTSDNPRNEDPKTILEDIQKGIHNKQKCQVICNRREAIYQALQQISKDDILLIAGKGHEPYQEINGVKHPFLDKAVVSDYFKTLTKDNYERNIMERL